MRISDWSSDVCSSDLNSRILAMLIGVAGLAYIFDYYVVRGGGLNLNIINFTFLFLAILLHGNARNLLNSLEEAIKGTAGIVIQFPFYAGIMADRKSVV